jgi:membrane protease subunit HflK
MINVARGEYNKAVPQAKGTAERSIQAAEGYAIQRVNQAQGDAAKFNALLAEYAKAPEVTKRRLYLETLQEVLPVVKNKIVLDDKAASVLPLLQLNAIQGEVR